ncbi:hypothetical protein TNCV_4482941 [Trichonephila clavipes]|nr:hypothetical protein TNCV_4482941 [Trichonephila clavipes]
MLFVVLSLFFGAVGILGSPNEQDVVYVTPFRSPRPVLLLTTTVAGITNPAAEFMTLDSISSTEMAATEPVPFQCGTSNPCGWQMYATSGLTRENREFIKSLCFCPNNTRCAHHRENIQLEAYEYRCQPISLPTINSTLTTTNSTS